MTNFYNTKNARSYPKAIVCVVFCLLRELIQVSTNLWLRYWISETEARDQDGAAPRTVSFYLAGYGVLVLFFLCFDITVNYISMVVCGIQAAKTLHERLITRILRLPMR